MTDYVGFNDVYLPLAAPINTIIQVLINNTTNVYKINKISATSPSPFSLTPLLVNIKMYKVINCINIKPISTGIITPTSIKEFSPNLIFGNNGIDVNINEKTLFRNYIFHSTNQTQYAAGLSFFNSLPEYAIIYNNIDAEIQDLTLRENEGILLSLGSPTSTAISLHVFTEFSK